MSFIEPFNLTQWIEENRDLLRPPVGNAQLFKATWRNFIVMVIGGPNQRDDYHDDPGEELFYQVQGDMVLRIIDPQSGRPRDLPIREGELFLLPPHVRHSPQRPADTVGLVVERLRLPGETDAFEWYDDDGQLMYRRDVEIKDIVKDLPLVFEDYHRWKAAQETGAG
ncbi:MAG: 3-hydroxyanthranilate 3,4-dioxygenase [Gammaproteobacteria bacterium]|nr:3-hydroxyanthranilate 3,4-dioxygenase [Gammaproteobacteria bacterium]